MRKSLFILTILPMLAWAALPQSDSNWALLTIDDAAGYGSVIVLQQDSAKTIRDESAAGDVIPRLEFRCKPGDPAITARIDWQRFISSFSTEVGFKVDGGKFTWLKWKVDASEQVTISPSAEDSQKLVRLLTGGSQLQVEVSPYSQGPETAEFDLSGFADSLQGLVNECQ